MEISFVVPTYNERENLSPLMEALVAVLKGHNFEIVIVDDSSPDGTGELAKKLSRKFPCIKVVHRKTKYGLASAILEGFSFAKGEILGVMDADFQHPPNKIPHLLKEIQNGADLVIASRYAEGGHIEHWSLRRRLTSKCATLLARIIFPKIKNVKDPLSGFFVIKREALVNVHLNPIGFKILLEILVAAAYNKIGEVPYAFKGRENGGSKLSPKEYFHYLQQIISLVKRLRACGGNTRK